MDGNYLLSPKRRLTEERKAAYLEKTCISCGKRYGT